MRTVAGTIPWWAAVVLGLVLCAACGSRQGEALVTSSAQHASYAARYPDAIDAEIEDFEHRVEEANAVLSEVPNFPKSLDDPDWPRVLEVIDAAVEAGRSKAYAGRVRETRHVQTFFEEEKRELHRRAGGAAQYAANQGGCTVQVSGAVARALDKAVDKQLEKRLRERNEAHLLIVRHREAIGDKNSEALAQQVDQLSYATYITFVELTESKRRLEAMPEEADTVRETADRFIAEEEAFQEEEGRTDAEKQESAARVASMKDARAKVAAAAEKARKTAEQMQQRIDEIQKDFDYIVGALQAEISQRGPKR